MPEPVRAQRILAQLPLFQGLEATDLAKLARAARYVTVRRDAFFFHEDDPADLFYVLRRGRVKQTQSAPGGREILLQFLGPGQIFGPTAVLEDPRYPVSVRAVCLAEAIAWPGAVMAKFMDEHPTVARGVLACYASMVDDLRDRLKELATERVETRVARAVLRLAEDAGWQTEDGVVIDMKLSRQDLAEMTGTTLYTVSRILQSWDRAGLVQVGRQRVAVRERAGLEALVLH